MSGAMLFRFSIELQLLVEGGFVEKDCGVEANVCKSFRRSAIAAVRELEA